MLDWNNEMYVSLFYQELKNEIKNKLTKIEWSDKLNDMIRIAVWINNQLWKKQQKKRKENSWKNQQEQNKDKKKNHEQSINWEYINNWKTDIFKNDCQKKNYVFIVRKRSIKSKNAKVYNKRNQ